MKAGPSRKALGEALDNQVADMTAGFKETKDKAPRRPATTTRTPNQRKEDDATAESKKLQKDIKAFLT